MRDRDTGGNDGLSRESPAKLLLAPAGGGDLFTAAMTIMRQSAARTADALHSGRLTIAPKNLRKINDLKLCLIFRQLAQAQTGLDFGIAEPDFSTELSTDLVDIVATD